MPQDKPEPLTRSQKEQLETELAELEGPKRAAMVEAIATARSFGDLSENFEYHAAKNEQGLLEARIRTLRSRLENSVLVDESMLNVGEVGVGSRVEIEDDDGGRMEVEISSIGGAGTVSPDSPLGRAVVGRREGESVEVQAPRGSWTARILAVKQP
jgi:transcription elongation factor GreA